MDKIKNNRIALYINGEKDEKIRYEMDNLIAQSAEFRSRNDFIWTAIRYFLKHVYKLPNENK